MNAHVMGRRSLYSADVATVAPLLVIRLCTTWIRAPSADLSPVGLLSGSNLRTVPRLPRHTHESLVGPVVSENF